MFASLIAYLVSGFCFLWGLGLLVFAINRADAPSFPASDFRHCVYSAVAFGGLSWVFAYLGGLS